MANSHWQTALKLLESNKIRRVVEIIAVLAMIYGIVTLLMETIWFIEPATATEWFHWLLKVFFNGIVLPVLGFFSRVDHNKTLALTKQIYECVTMEMALVKELTINTHTLIAKIFENKEKCENYKSKVDNKK